MSKTLNAFSKTAKREVTQFFHAALQFFFKINYFTALIMYRIIHQLEYNLHRY